MTSTSTEQRTLLTFRLAVLGLTAVLAFEWATRFYSAIMAVPGRPHPLLLSWDMALFAVLWFLLFAATFWATTEQIVGDRPSRRLLLLLAFQFFLAWGGSFELLVIVACQTSLLLSGRALRLCLTLECVLPLAKDLFDLSSAHFQVSRDELGAGFTRWSPLVAWTLTEIHSLAWKGFAAATGWMISRAVRSRRELLRASAGVRASRELLAENARVAERIHLSRELHDVLGHHLAALSQHLELARRRADRTDADAVSQVRDLVLRILERLRSVVSTVRRPVTLKLAAALRTMAAAAGPGFEVSVAEDVHLDPVRTEALFHCACETLGAAILAGGSPKGVLDVRRQRDGEKLTISVGRSQDSLLTDATLRGLRERLVAVGGTIDARISDGTFRVEVVVPDAGRPR